VKKEKLENSKMSTIARLPKEELSKIKLIRWREVRTIVRLNDLVEEYGVIFVYNPNGLPLKITSAELT